jgi:hypothetical protein
MKPSQKDNTTVFEPSTHGDLGEVFLKEAYRIVNEWDGEYLEASCVLEVPSQLLGEAALQQHLSGIPFYISLNTEYHPEEWSLSKTVWIVSTGTTPTRTLTKIFWSEGA